MFSKSNLCLKYKTYSKSLKIIKEKYVSFDKEALSNVQSNFRTVKNDILVTVNNRFNVTNFTKIVSSNIKGNEASISQDHQSSKASAAPKLLDGFNNLNRSWLKKLRSKPLLSAAVISSGTAAIPEAIPEPPPVPVTDVFPEIVETLNALGEPTLRSLGLAGWSPVGMVQQCLEYLHVTCDIPWWGAITIGTIVVRICMFPLVVIAQRNGAKMNNYMPQLQMLQLKMTEARQSGNQLEAARYSQEMMIFMREKGVNPLKNMVVPLAQMPVFLSFFMGLRGMCNVPVESLSTGGIFWFTDLILPDQYFALPVITSLTLWLTIEIGTDSAKLSAQNMQVMKYVLRALPVCILPFTINFPGAILCYWLASNVISLGQVGFLKIPSVRTYFKIEPHVSHNPENLPVKNKGFVAGVKDSWTNMKITRDLEERRRVDEVQFQKAGKGPVQKTYKYDPTKQSTATGPKVIRAKER